MRRMWSRCVISVTVFCNEAFSRTARADASRHGDGAQRPKPWPLWRGDHVPIKQLIEDFARYLYLPRLKESPVLLQSIGDGLALLTWGKDSFAFAESYDESSGRYRGLRCGQMVAVSSDNRTGVLVKPDIARKQLARGHGSAYGTVSAKWFTFETSATIKLSSENTLACSKPFTEMFASMEPASIEGHEALAILTVPSPLAV
jgi:hypothetical protein